MAEHPEACAERRDDLAAWAVAQIDPEREAALDAHLATCAACRREADELVAVAAVALSVDLAQLGAAPIAPPAGDQVAEVMEPPADLGARISARIRRERRRQIRRRALVAAVGAAAAAAVVVVSLVALSGDDGPGRVRGEQFAFTQLPAGATATAVVGEDPGGSVVRLSATGLDPGTTYALWLSDPETHPERVPAGTFRPDDDGTVEVVLHCALPARAVGRVWATTTDGLALDTA